MTGVLQLGTTDDFAALYSKPAPYCLIPNEQVVVRVDRLAAVTAPFQKRPKGPHTTSIAENKIV